MRTDERVFETPAMYKIGLRNGWSIVHPLRSTCCQRGYTVCGYVHLSVIVLPQSVFLCQLSAVFQLRSTSSNPLYIPRVKTKAGTRAFSVAAPTFPASVKSEGNIASLRRRLQTYLCNAA